jgi:hypothetical protein
VAGFGVLAGFYAIRSTPPELPGLYDYYSATLGDGILLPACIGCLLFSIQELSPARYERIASVCTGLGGAALGTITQLQWLSDDHPRLNWTIPEPHYFNAAGIYHAAYLVALSGIIPALWSVALLRIIQVGNIAVARRKLAKRCLLAAFSSDALFAFLVIVDNQVSTDTAATRATNRALIAGAVSACAVATVVGILRRKNVHR